MEVRRGTGNDVGSDEDGGQRKQVRRRCVATKKKAVEEMGRIRRGGTRAERYWVSAYLVPG